MELRDFITVGSDVSYRDVLSEQFYSEYFATKENSAFLEALRRYKQISRDDADAISDRVSSLNEVENTLDLSDMYQSCIRQNILKKENQLKALKKLFDLQVLRNEKELYNPEIEQLFKSKDLLDLKNDPIYDFSDNVLLGNYVLEAIDPSHRFTTNSYIRPWQEQNSVKPFFLYLEKNCDYDLIPQIEYFADDKLEKSKIAIKDGKLYTSDGNLLTTDDREFLFVLGKNNEFYGCYSKKGIKHTSLSHGDSIKCGGAITAKDGNITSISLDSGHYFPSLVYLNKLAYYLEQNGVKVPRDTPVNYHENYVRKMVTFGQGAQR